MVGACLVLLPQAAQRLPALLQVVEQNGGVIVVLEAHEQNLEAASVRVLQGNLDVLLLDNLAHAARGLVSVKVVQMLREQHVVEVVDKDERAVGQQQAEAASADSLPLGADKLKHLDAELGVDDSLDCVGVIGDAVFELCDFFLYLIFLYFDFFFYFLIFDF